MNGPTAPTAAADGNAAPPDKGWIRRLYDWVLSWAYTPYALPALVLLSFAESSFFPIPPDVLLLPLCMGYRLRAMRFAAWCTAASVLGGALGYWIGATLWQAGVDQFFFQYVPGFTPTVFNHAQDAFERWNFWVVLTAGFTPIPYKVITISAGVFGVDFWIFLIASALGRGARFFLVAWLCARYGAPIREFIEKRLGILSLLFMVLLIGGFVLIKYVL